MKIRAVNELDITALTAFMGHWGPEAEGLSPEDVQLQIRHCKERVSGDLFVALNDQNEIIAYLQMVEISLVGFAPAAEIAALLVHTELRGQGIGTQLIEFAKRWTAEKGLKRLLLSSQMHRNRAHSFYTRSGFSRWKESAFFEMLL